MTYISKAAATSVCNTQRAYSTMQIIQGLPCAKVVDKERFNSVVNELGNTITDTGDRFVIAQFVNEIEEKLFGGAK